MIRGRQCRELSLHDFHIAPPYGPGQRMVWADDDGILHASSNERSKNLHTHAWTYAHELVGINRSLEERDQIIGGKNCRGMMKNLLLG